MSNPHLNAFGDHLDRDVPFDEEEVYRYVAATEAAEYLADTFAKMGTADDVAPKLTCWEAEALVNLFHAIGRDDVADAWLNAHVLADDDDEASEIHGLDTDTGA